MKIIVKGRCPVCEDWQELDHRERIAQHSLTINEERIVYCGGTGHWPDALRREEQPE